MIWFNAIGVTLLCVSDPLLTASDVHRRRVPNRLDIVERCLRCLAVLAFLACLAVTP